MERNDQYYLQNPNMQNQMMQDQSIENQDMSSGNTDEPIDWDDGKIHTVVTNYCMNDPENWHKNVNYQDQYNEGTRYIKGRQVGVHVETNEPRVMLPFWIIACVILIIITIILLSIEMTRFMGVIWAAFTVMFIASILQQNISKWKKFLKTLKDDKNKK